LLFILFTGFDSCKPGIEPGNPMLIGKWIYEKSPSFIEITKNTYTEQIDENARFSADIKWVDSLNFEIEIIKNQGPTNLRVGDKVKIEIIALNESFFQFKAKGRCVFVKRPLSNGPYGKRACIDDTHNSGFTKAGLQDTNQPINFRQQ
jgi:hypothetical protein